MKVLVIGASGLVGGNCQIVFRERGWNVVGTCNRHPQLGLLPLDLADPAAVDSLLQREQPEAVVNCAGWSWVDGCERDRARAFRENCEQPGRLARVAHQAGARVVHFSTSYVFDGRNGPYDEQALPNPISIYGSSKLAGEQRVQAATSQTALVIRTMGVYGPELQRKNFVDQVIDRLSRSETMQIPNDQYGNVSHAAELAEGVARLLEGNYQGLWNLAGPDPELRRDQFALRIAKAYGLSVNLLDFISTESLQQPAARPRQAGLVINKAQRQLGWQPSLWKPLL